MTAPIRARITKNLTVRNVPEEVHQALEREKSRRGQSLNQTVIDLLSERLSLRDTRSNGLARLAGTWSQQDYSVFEASVAGFETIDDEPWR